MPDNEIIGALELEFVINNPALLEQLDVAQANFTSATAKIEADVKRAGAAMANLIAKGGFSDSQAEVDAYTASIQNLGDAGQTAASGTAALIQVLNADLQAGKISAEEFRAAMTGISESQNSLAAATTRSNAAEAEQIGLLENLQTVLKQLKAENLTIVDETKLARSNALIQETEAELSRLSNVGKVGYDEFGVKIQKVNTELTEEMGLIARLQAELAALKATNPTIIDPAKLAAANAQIQALEAEIKRASNVGKVGFDALGNALPTERTGAFGNAISRVTNLSNIGANVVSRLSRQVIGLGVGMLSFAVGAKAIEFLVDYISNLEIFSGKLNAARQALKAYNDIQDAAAKSAAPNIANLKILYDSATDVSQAYDKRVASAEKLKELFPNELGSVNALALANGKLKSKIDEVSDALLRQATTEAALNKIRELEAQKLDLKAKQLEIQAKADLDKSNAKGYAAGSSGGLPGTGGGSYQPAITAAQNRAGIQQMADYQKNKLDPQIKAIDQTIALVTKAAGGAKVLAGELEGINKLIENPLENFDTIVKNAGSKADLDNLKKSLQAKLDSLAPNDAQIALYNNKIQKVKELEKQYEVKANDGQSEKTAAQNLLAAQISELQKIDALKDKYASKSKTRDEQEADAIKANFTAQGKAIDALNVKYDAFVKKYGTKAANAAGLQRIDPATLQPTETAALAGLAGTQALEQTKIQIDKQKELYREYEEYKLKFGTDAANQLYANELKGYTSYVKYLESLQPTEAALNSDQPKVKAAASALKDYLSKEIPKANTEASKSWYSEMVGNLSRILDATKTSASQRLKIEDQYQRDVINVAFNYYGKDADERLRLLKRNKDLALDQAKTLAFEQTQVGIDAANNLFNLTSAQLKAQIAKLKADLKAGTATDSNGNVTAMTPAQQKQVQGALDSARQLEIATDPTAKAFGKIADYAGAAAAGFNQLAASLADINPALSDTVASAGELSGIVGNVANLATSIMSGNVAGIITGVFSVVSGVVGFFNRGAASAKAAAAELQKYQDSLITGQITYNELLRDQARTLDDISTLTITELKAREQMLTLQKSQAQADYNTLLQQISDRGNYVTGEHSEKYGGIFGIGQKTKVVQDLASTNGLDYDALLKLYTEGKLGDETKAWFEQLKNVHDELNTIGVSAQEALDTINKAATGTTASTIADAIIDGFRQGKRTAADFADNFKQLMQSAALSTFENEYLNGKIAEFYKSFAAASEGDGGLTQAKIDALRAQYNKIIADAGIQIGNIENITGQSLTSTDSSSSPSTLQGEIKGITADEATKLEGTFHGIQLSVNRSNELLQNVNNSQQSQLAELKQQTIYQKQIEANTRRTADSIDNQVTPALNQIASNTSGSLASMLRAAGKYGF